MWPSFALIGAQPENATTTRRGSCRETQRCVGHVHSVPQDRKKRVLKSPRSLACSAVLADPSSLHSPHRPPSIAHRDWSQRDHPAAHSSRRSTRHSDAWTDPHAAAQRCDSLACAILHQPHRSSSKPTACSSRPRSAAEPRDSLADLSHSPRPHHICTLALESMGAYSSTHLAPEEIQELSDKTNCETTDAALQHHAPITRF